MSAEVVVYTMASCPYCTAAKSLLDQRGIPYKEILVANDDDQTWDDLLKRSGMRTMPQIYHGEAVIGGFQELSELDKKDNLSSLKGA